VQISKVTAPSSWQARQKTFDTQQLQLLAKARQ